MKQTIAEDGLDISAEDLTHAASEGCAWAESVRARLADDGRPACGGWPGTLSEARARIDRKATDSPSKRERLSRLLYDAAREFWLQNRDPHVQEPSHK